MYVNKDKNLNIIVKYAFYICIKKCFYLFIDYFIQSDNWDTFLYMLLKKFSAADVDIDPRLLLLFIMSHGLNARDIW